MRTRRMLVLVGVFYAALCGAVDWSSVVRADDTVPTEPAVVNNPVGGWDLTKDVVSYLEPGADWIVTFTDGEPIEGFSGAIYTATSKGFPIASLRAGYGLTDPVTYGSLALDLPGLTGRFLPAAVKNLSPGVLTSAATYAAKYIRIGPVGGYDWSRKKPVYGLAIGAAISF